MFWILAALLTAIVTATVVWPIVQRRPHAAASRADHDTEVYAAQLAELDADRARGTIGHEDARIARAEIGRRLLRSARGAEEGRAADATARSSLLCGLLVAAGLPLASLAVYAKMGAPDMADRPLALRKAEAPANREVPGADVAGMVAAAEARLEADPRDGRGWDVLAPIYLRLGETNKAVAAYRNALDLLDETPERLLGYGEALMRSAGGEVTDDARAAFEGAAELDPALLAPRVFLALDLSQERRFSEASAAWRAVLEESPADAPWRPIAEAALREAQKETTGAGPAPTEIAAAAAAMPEAHRDERIAAMVAGLAARLEESPQDAEAWVRLIRAYGVLGDEAAADAALERARAAFPPGSAEWTQIAASAEAMGRPLGGEARP